jgi:hypothetical protein
MDLVRLSGGLLVKYKKNCIFYFIFSVYFCLIFPVFYLVFSAFLLKYSNKILKILEDRAIEYWYRHSYGEREPFHRFFSLEVKPACLPCSLAISATVGVWGSRV